MAAENRMTPPVFDDEAQEAQWWDQNQARVEENLRTAMREGTVQRDSAGRLLRESRASKNITIRMSLEDLERARQLSAKRGLAYQTYMKMLLHEALDREEKRLVA
jgi:predicted DNA binding CopG/RHH family protein